MAQSLNGQIALVTGASRGIGAATAEALAAAGAHVVLTARTAGGLEEVEERIHAGGGSATIAPLDLVDGDSIGRLATALAERWGVLDILVLNAATLGALSPVPAIDGKEFNRILTMNLIAQQAMIAGFDPLMRRSRDCKLVALTSSVGARPRAYWGAYGASKAAMEALLLSYAEEVKDISAIRLAIVDPGATATQMRARAYPGEDPSTIQSPADAAAAIVRFIREDYRTGFRFRAAGSARSSAAAIES